MRLLIARLLLTPAIVAAGVLISRAFYVNDVIAMVASIVLAAFLLAASILIGLESDRQQRRR